MGYAMSLVSTDPLAAVKILSTNAVPYYYGQSHSVAGDPQEGGYTTAEKYMTMTSGVVNKEYGNNGVGIDVMYSIGAGPYSLNSTTESILAVAVIAGDNLADLQASAAAAQAKYDNFVTTLGVNETIANQRAFVYPNPAQDNVSIVIPTEATNATVSEQFSGLNDTFQLNNLKLVNGVYSVVVKTTAGEYVNKLIIE
jgi:hypothetical protein